VNSIGNARCRWLVWLRPAERGCARSRPAPELPDGRRWHVGRAEPAWPAAGPSARMGVQLGVSAFDPGWRGCGGSAGIRRRRSGAGWRPAAGRTWGGGGADNECIAEYSATGAVPWYSRSMFFPESGKTPASACSSPPRPMSSRVFCVRAPETVRVTPHLCPGREPFSGTLRTRPVRFRDGR
jgi:hypothetical protein